MKKIFTIILFFGITQTVFALNITVYPEPDVATVAGDGVTVRIIAAQSWAQIHDSAGNDKRNNAATENIWDLQSDTNPNWQALWRNIINFDTSGIGSGNTISSSTFSVSGVAKGQVGGITPTFGLATATPISYTQAAAADYQSIGTIDLATADITHANFGTGPTWNRWTLNATGLSWISKTSVTSLSIRDMTYDAPNSAPTWASGESYAQAAFADTAGTSSDPELSVDYTVPATASISQESDFLTFD